MFHTEPDSDTLPVLMEISPPGTRSITSVAGNNAYPGSSLSFNGTDSSRYHEEGPFANSPCLVLKEIQPKVYQCSICVRTFTRPHNLKHHLPAQTGEKSRRCQKCGQSFGRLDALKRHASLHIEHTTYKCGHVHARETWGCGREFSRAEDLVRHFKSLRGTGRVKSRPPIYGPVLHPDNLVGLARDCVDVVDDEDDGYDS